jgi:hypothetical protein
MSDEEEGGDTPAKGQYECGSNATEDIAKMPTLTNPLQVSKKYRHNHGRFNSLAKKNNEGWYHVNKPLLVEDR